jgi:hypothetical protein
VCESTGRELVSLRTENAALKREPPRTSTSVLLVIALTVLGVGGGYAAGRLIR